MRGVRINGIGNNDEECLAPTVAGRNKNGQRDGDQVSGNRNDVGDTHQNTQQHEVAHVQHAKDGQAIDRDNAH